MAAVDIDELKHKKYIALTTVRRSGATVTTPVWFAIVDGRLGFRTEAHAGKVKRIRNNPNVQWSECDMRGHVREDAVAWDATAEIVQGASAEQINSALTRKYGLAYRLITVWAKIRAFFRRSPSEVAFIAVSLNHP